MSCLPPAHIQKNMLAVQPTREWLFEALAKIPGLKPFKPSGTYFMAVMI